ncbi:MAG: hypothetical protein KA807_15870 [Prolixibacteraceae bacterium]|nr:hypothetical protein [Prolixibacteraceae bacterium]
MARRESKSKFFMRIDAVGKTSEVKGHIELTSGNISYFRKSAPTETIRLTYQQLFDVLEREIEYQSINTTRLKLPNSHEDGDFTLYLNQVDETEELRFPIESTVSLNKCDARRLDCGQYQFSHSMAKGFSIKRPRRYEWLAHVSVQAALWILNLYVDKFLTRKRMSAHEDKDIVVSKERMREVLLMLFKKVDY